MKTIRSLLLMLAMLPAGVQAAMCEGRFMNPITDVSWISVFPISVGPVKVDMGQADAGDNAPMVCVCPMAAPPFFRIGVGTGFWEPARVAEVVRKPFCSPAFGGITLADLSTPPGAVSKSGGGDNSAFYHTHWFIYPLLQMVNALKDGLCGQPVPMGIDLLYMTELDPLWMDDELAFLLNPEAALFASPVAQAACLPDCLAASAGFPLNELFWCAGCNGALYPLGGTVADHQGGLQTSLLLIQRMAAKLHRQFIAMDTSSMASLCFDQPMPILPKRQYKTQVAYPIPRTSTSHPMGRTSSIWGSGQEYPVKGENWVHLIWRKNLCCAF